jgi:prepilin-type N-terminal cleavage/methylation domain-containing protein
MKKDSARRAFTLIEILVVTLILSVISLAIFSTFSSGIAIWHRINSRLTQEDLVIFCQMFASDLRGSFKFKAIAFKGDEERVEFVSLVNSRRLNTKTVGRLSYAYNPDKKTLSKFQEDFSAVYVPEELKPKYTLKDVKSVKFQYYCYDSAAKEYVWLEEWVKKSSLPLAVRLEMEFDKASMPERLVRTFTIPAGGQ